MVSIFFSSLHCLWSTPCSVRCRSMKKWWLLDGFYGGALLTCLLHFPSRPVCWVRMHTRSLPLSIYHRLCICMHALLCYVCVHAGRAALYVDADGWVCMCMCMRMRTYWCMYLATYFAEAAAATRNFQFGAAAGSPQHVLWLWTHISISAAGSGIILVSCLTR